MDSSISSSSSTNTTFYPKDIHQHEIQLHKSKVNKTNVTTLKFKKKLKRNHLLGTSSLPNLRHSKSIFQRSLSYSNSFIMNNNGIAETTTGYSLHDDHLNNHNDNNEDQKSTLQMDRTMKQDSQRISINHIGHMNHKNGNDTGNDIDDTIHEMNSKQEMTNNMKTATSLNFSITPIEKGFVHKLKLMALTHSTMNSSNSIISSDDDDNENQVNHVRHESQQKKETEREKEVESNQVMDLISSGLVKRWGPKHNVDWEMDASDTQQIENPNCVNSNALPSSSSLSEKKESSDQCEQHLKIVTSNVEVNSKSRVLSPLTAGIAGSSVLAPSINGVSAIVHIMIGSWVTKVKSYFSFDHFLFLH